jgi:hypothetical protein
VGIDEDLMYLRGTIRLEKLFVPYDTVIDAAPMNQLIRLMGMTNLPANPIPYTRSVDPEYIPDANSRDRMEKFKAVIQAYRAEGAYVELDEQGSSVVGLYYLRERTKPDDVVGVTLNLPESLRKLSLRDTQVTGTILLPLLETLPNLEVLNLVNTGFPGRRPRIQPGRPSFAGTPGVSGKPCQHIGSCACGEATRDLPTGKPGRPFDPGTPDQIRDDIDLRAPRVPGLTCQDILAIIAGEYVKERLVLDRSCENEIVERLMLGNPERGPGYSDYVHQGITIRFRDRSLVDPQRIKLFNGDVHTVFDPAQCCERIRPKKLKDLGDPTQ